MSIKKSIVLLTLSLFGVCTLSGCTKDEILDHYNTIVQSAGSAELTGNLSLQGKKEKGIDDYTGSYQADYKNFSNTEYLFGGTSIKREAGKEISVTCNLEVDEGTAKVFWSSGAEEPVTLIETTGEYKNTITLPDGGVVVKHFCNTLFENSPGISSFKWCFPIIVGMRTDMIVPYVHISV